MEQQRSVERRLAAILSADVQGYSRLMAEDEVDTVRTLNACREVIATIVGQHRGRVVDQPGDNLLAEFPSAVEAVICGIETQQALKARNAELPANRRMEFRIGIHVGEVMVEGERIYGDGVNIAARLEKLSAPGGMCVSERVYEDVSNKLSIEAKYLGEKSLKNVAHPVRAWALATAQASGASPKSLPGRAVHALRSIRHPWLVAGAAVLLLTSLGLFSSRGIRTEVGVAEQLYLPRLLPKQFAQKIDFCTTSDGVRIAYGTTGEGQPVIFVLGWVTHLEHGFGSGTYGSLPVAMLGTSHLVVQYDGRGFGMSDRGLKDHSLETRVHDLEAVVDALKLRRFALWGISAGGSATIAYAARHPERVTRVVLQATWAKYDFDLLNAEERDRLRTFWDQMVRYWGNPAYQDLFVSLAMPDGTEVSRRFVREMLRISGTEEDTRSFISAFIDADVTSPARQIRAPTLVVHVRGDELVPLELGKQLAELIPGSRLVIVEGRNHVSPPWFSEFGQVAQVIKPFLDQDLSVPAAEPPAR